jgi:hypothetical protein
MQIKEIIKSLEDASRYGRREDVPEGTRYIKLSDTLAKKIVIKLTAMLNKK